MFVKEGRCFTGLFYCIYKNNVNLLYLLNAKSKNKMNERLPEAMLSFRELYFMREHVVQDLLKAKDWLGKVAFYGSRVAKKPLKNFAE